LKAFGFKVIDFYKKKPVFFFIFLFLIIMVQIFSFGLGFPSMITPFISGIKLNIYNIVVFPIVLGFGLYSLVMNIKEFKDYTMGKTMDSGCCRFRLNTLITSITLFAFFIILSLSEYYGQRSLGILAATGIFSTTAAVIIFPGLIKKTSRKIEHGINKWRKKCME